ncbi:MAG TPA: hypothetical protein VFE46_10760 [Pirellulales bacterium]|nr:hypothetical protein [Pirellulales bacterium]
MLAAGSGVPFATFVGNMRQMPEKRFETTQLVTVLGAAGMTIGDWSANATNLYYRKVTPFGTRDALGATTGQRLQASIAGVMIHRVSARQGGLASADCCVYIPYDGTNAPIASSSGVAVSGTPSSTEQFTLGPVFINGSQVFGITDWTIDFGQQVIQTISDGELYPTFIAIGDLKPVVTFRGLDFSWTSFAGLNGVSITSASFYLRAMSAAGRVANGTSAHIKFSALAGLAYVDDVSGGGNDQSQTSCRLNPISSNGTTLPLTVATGVAITS